MCGHAEQLARNCRDTAKLMGDVGVSMEGTHSFILSLTVALAPSLSHFFFLLLFLLISSSSSTSSSSIPCLSFSCYLLLFYLYLVPFSSSYASFFFFHYTATSTSSSTFSKSSTSSSLNLIFRSIFQIIFYNMLFFISCYHPRYSSFSFSLSRLLYSSNQIIIITISYSYIIVLTPDHTLNLIITTINHSITNKQINSTR